MNNRIENIKKMCKSLIFLNDDVNTSKISEMEDLICKSIDSQKDLIELSNYMVVSIIDNNCVQKFYAENPYNDVYNQLCIIGVTPPSLREVSVYSTKDMKQLIKIPNGVIMMIHKLSLMREICENDEELKYTIISINACFEAMSNIIERALKATL